MVVVGTITIIIAENNIKYQNCLCNEIENLSRVSMENIRCAAKLLKLNYNFRSRCTRCRRDLLHPMYVHIFYLNTSIIIRKNIPLTLRDLGEDYPACITIAALDHNGGFVNARERVNYSISKQF